MKIFDRIIYSTIVTATLLVSVVILGIQSFLSLIQQFYYTGQYEFGLWQAFLYTLMQLPAQFYQLFPVVGFLGALIGLNRLSATSQLIVMRVSGFSITRIAWSVMKIAVAMMIVVTVIGEGFSPQWQQQSEKMRQAALSPSTHPLLLKSVWLHQGNNFTHIGELTNKNEMEDITNYRFNTEDHLAQASIAQSGQLIHHHWELSHLKKTIFEPHHVAIKTESQAEFHFIFQPDLQVQMSIISTKQTLMDLYQTIRYRESIGLDANQYIFSFWQRLLQPITTVVMICLAVPFVFGALRHTSMGIRILSGVFIGFSFYMLNQLFGPITLVYQFPPLFAAIIPTCLFLLIAVILLFYVE